MSSSAEGGWWFTECWTFCHTALPSDSGVTIHAPAEPMTAAPPVIRVRATQPRRTRVTSTLRYSAMPPDTPESIRWLAERRRGLPDGFWNGALEFVMAPPSRSGACRHIRIGTDRPLIRPLEPRSGAPDDFRPTAASGVRRQRPDWSCPAELRETRWTNRS